MVDFYKDWYNNLIAHSNEKDLLVQKISDLLKGKTHESCLEIGLGTSAYFASHLGSYFEDYQIVEKEEFNDPLPSNVHIVHGDFETTEFDKQFDVILASHVVYYFRDLPGAVEKIASLLKKGGRAYFVVNGRESDYGPIKDAFAEFINKPYTFTYDILKNSLSSYSVREYTTQASLSFSSYEDLYETLRLSFDLYPKEYEENRNNVIGWLKESVKGDKFFIDQKIIEVAKL
ncbi:methyltransferase domain-containing protein [Candidatus Campbellbacteria bacterium]|nr:MAG: methyltransferase domain-containing protein [Candidatus Campbellbacteria bacterium]